MPGFPPKSQSDALGHFGLRDALIMAHRASLIFLMSELPEAAVATVMREFATRGHRMDQANLARDRLAPGGQKTDLR
jgi:hypothetical protein